MTCGRKIKLEHEHKEEFEIQAEYSSLKIRHSRCFEPNQLPEPFKGSLREEPLKLTKLENQILKETFLQTYPCYESMDSSIWFGRKIPATING